MKIIDHFADFEPMAFPIVTMGTFDGVHIGHLKILKDLVGQAKAKNGESIVITFWPHPRFVLGKNAGDLKLLTTFDEKVALLAESGVDYLLKVRFSRKFSELTSEQFIQKVLVGGIHTSKLIIGYDHRFGKDQEGGFQYLRDNQDRFGFEVKEIPRQDIDHVTVSSTKIRRSLSEGNVEQANELLGRPYRLQGLVIKGEQIGRKIGYPTANIYIPEEYKLIPGDGVYAVQVHLESGTWQGMLNIGNRPTVDGRMRTIEVHIFDFDSDIYGLKITITFVQMLRKEKRFNDMAELADQLKMDKQLAINILNTNKSK